VNEKKDEDSEERKKKSKNKRGKKRKKKEKKRKKKENYQNNNNYENSFSPQIQLGHIMRRNKKENIKDWSWNRRIFFNDFKKTISKVIFKQGDNEQRLYYLSETKGPSWNLKDNTMKVLDESPRKRNLSMFYSDFKDEEAKKEKLIRSIDYRSNNGKNY
jgi:hypothetical protein